MVWCVKLRVGGVGRVGINHGLSSSKRLQEVEGCFREEGGEVGVIRERALERAY